MRFFVHLTLSNSKNWNKNKPLMLNEKRKYQCIFIEKKSKKFSFIPELLENFEKKKTFKFCSQKRFLEIFYKKLSQFFIGFFFLKIFLKFVLFSQSYNFTTFFFLDDLMRHFNGCSFLYFYASTTPDKYFNSKFFDFATISFLFFWTTMNIEKFLFLNRNHFWSFAVSAGNLVGIILLLWNKYEVRKGFRESYSKKIIPIRDLRVILTFFSLLNFWRNFKISASFLRYKIKSFPPFFADFSSTLGLKESFSFSKNFINFNAGADFIFIISILIFLYFGTFPSKKPLNKIYILKKKLEKLTKSPFSAQKFQKPIDSIRSSVFIEKNLEKLSKPIYQGLEDDSFDKFSPDFSSKRWKIKRAGICVPFPIFMWENELPFKKKSVKWNIKNKDS